MGNPRAVVAIVNEKDEHNIFDQRDMGERFLKMGIKYILIALCEVDQHLRLEEDRRLFYQR